VVVVCCFQFYELVSVSKSTEFLLTGGVPDFQHNGPASSVEFNRCHRGSHGGLVLINEFARIVTVDEGGFARGRRSNNWNFEGGDLFYGCSHKE